MKVNPIYKISIRFNDFKVKWTAAIAGQFSGSDWRASNRCSPAGGASRGASRGGFRMKERSTEFHVAAGTSLTSPEKDLYGTVTQSGPIILTRSKS